MSQSEDRLLGIIGWILASFLLAIMVSFAVRLLIAIWSQ